MKSKFLTFTFIIASMCAGAANAGQIRCFDLQQSATRPVVSAEFSRGRFRNATDYAFDTDDDVRARKINLTRVTGANRSAEYPEFNEYAYTVDEDDSNVSLFLPADMSAGEFMAHRLNESWGAKPTNTELSCALSYGM